MFDRDYDYKNSFGGGRFIFYIVWFHLSTCSNVKSQPDPQADKNIRVLYRTWHCRSSKTDNVNNNETHCIPCLVHSGTNGTPTAVHTPYTCASVDYTSDRFEADFQTRFQPQVGGRNWLGPGLESHPVSDVSICSTTRKLVQVHHVMASPNTETCSEVN